MADAEGISLEETNKIRISLGLKPLTDDKEPVNKQEATAEDNYAKRREEEREQKKKRYGLVDSPHEHHLILIILPVVTFKRGLISESPLPFCHLQTATSIASSFPHPSSVVNEVVD